MLMALTAVAEYGHLVLRIAQTVCITMAPTIVRASLVDLEIYMALAVSLGFFQVLKASTTSC